MQNNSSRKKRWLIIGGVTLLLILFVLVVDLQEIAELLSQTSWGLWLIGAAFLVAGYVVNTLRWRYVLAGRPDFKLLFCSDSVAYMSNMVTPIPAVASRVVTTGRITSASIPQATSGMVIDRVLETTMRLIAFILILSLLAIRQSKATSAIVSYLTIVVLAVSLLAWVSKHQQLVIDKLVRWLSRLPRLSEERIRSTVGALLQNLASAGSTSRLITGLIISIVKRDP